MTVAAALVLHGLLVVWLTWPLAAHLATHLPATVPACRFDPLYSAWALAWQATALVRGMPLGDANIYHPAREAFWYGAPGYGALLWFAPVFLVTGNPTLAVNVLFLAGLTTTAAAAHWVVARWTGSFAAGTVAGTVLLANRWMLWDLGPTAPRLATLTWLPLCIAATVRPTTHGRAVLGVAALVAVQGLTDPVYVAPAVFAPLAGVALWRCARPGSRAAGLALLGALSLAALVVGLAHWPLLALRLRHPDLAQQSFWSATGARPSRDLPWDLMAPLSPLAVPTAVLALTVLGGIARLTGPLEDTARDGASWRHALWWTAAGTLLSTLDAAHVGGEPLLAALGQVLRAPQRLGVAGLFGLALLAGLAAAALADATARSTRAGVTARALCRGMLAVAVIALACLQYRSAFGQPASYGSPLPRRYPIAPAIAGTSPVLSVLGQSRGPLLEGPLLPLAPTAPEVHARAMYRAIFHGRRLLNGYNSYWPRDFPRLMRLAARLPAPDALERLRLETGLGWILVDLAAPVEGAWMLAGVRQRWAAAADGGAPGLEVAARDGPLVLFRVAGPPEEEPAGDR